MLVTKMSNQGQQSLSLSEAQGTDYNYAASFTPAEGEAKLMISVCSHFENKFSKGMRLIFF